VKWTRPCLRLRNGSSCHTHSSHSPPPHHHRALRQGRPSGWFPRLLLLLHPQPNRTSTARKMPPTAQSSPAKSPGPVPVPAAEGRPRPPIPDNLQVNIGAFGPFWACEISVSPGLWRRAKYSVKPWLKLMDFCFHLRPGGPLLETLRRSLPKVSCNTVQEVNFDTVWVSTSGPPGPLTPARPARGPPSDGAVASCNKLIPATVSRTPFRETHLTFTQNKSRRVSARAVRVFGAARNVGFSNKPDCIHGSRYHTGRCRVRAGSVPHYCDRDSHEGS
jgi:hypothetical protein